MSSLLTLTTSCLCNKGTYEGIAKEFINFWNLITLKQNVQI
jgi:hypothetical protein